MKRLRLACLVLGLLAHPAADGQSRQDLLQRLPPDVQEMDKELRRLFGDMAAKDKAMLERVRTALRNSAAPSAPWLRTLDRIALDVPAHDVWDFQARAMAFARPGSGRGKPVTINQLMSFAVHDKAFLAARRMAVNLSGMPDNHPDDMLLGLEAQSIIWHAMAWIVAHEIAHHRLNHTARDPASLEESRKWELDADRLGFEMLNDAGFSLYVLAWYLETMTTVEALRRDYGLDRTAEQSARHPLWKRRYEALRSALHSLPRPPERWQVMSSFKRYEKGSPLVKQTFLIPHALDASAVASLTQVSRGETGAPQIIPGIGGFERQGDGAANIYLRAGDSHIACRMDNRLAPVTNVRCNYRLGANTGSSTQTFYRDSFAAAFAAIDSRDIEPLFRLGGMETVRAVLTQTVPDASLRAQAARLIERQLATRQSLLLRYTRGDISEQDFFGRISVADQRDPQEVRQLLGPSLYAAYEMRTREHYEETVRRAMGK